MSWVTTIILRDVRLMGVEPTSPYGDQLLRLARLPVPPKPHYASVLTISNIIFATIIYENIRSYLNWIALPTHGRYPNSFQLDENLGLIGNDNFQSSSHWTEVLTWFFQRISLDVTLHLRVKLLQKTTYRLCRDRWIWTTDLLDVSQTFSTNWTISPNIAQIILNILSYSPN